MLKRRPFGNTGLQVSELILGAGYVGGIVIHADDETRRALMRRLLEAGINWIDTAESYGQGASEEALGWLLAELPEDNRPYISTKFRLDTDRLDNIPGQIETSSHCHSVNHCDYRLLHPLYPQNHPLGQTETAADVVGVLRYPHPRFAAALQSIQVASSAEGVSGSGEDQYSDIIVSGHIINGLSYLVGGVVVESVPAIWPVDS